MLMQAVRTVFNIAIGADSADLQRTARSALLQMLNTVVKRITMATVVRTPNLLVFSQREASIGLVVIPSLSTVCTSILHCLKPSGCSFG